MTETAPSAVTDADAEMTAQLAEALCRDGEPWPGAPAPEVIAAALLPIVQRIADQRAAEKLAAVAAELDDLYETGGAFGAGNLTAAARLDRYAASLRAKA